MPSDRATHGDDVDPLAAVLALVPDPDPAPSGRSTRSIPRPPAGTGPSGRRWWRAVAERYRFADHEWALVVEAVRVVDRLDALHALVTADGMILAGKAHPALVEARLQGITLARLIAALRLPDPDADGARPQRRGGARGTYRHRGADVVPGTHGRY